MENQNIEKFLRQKSLRVLLEAVRNFDNNVCVLGIYFEKVSIKPSMPIEKRCNFCYGISVKNNTWNNKFASPTQFSSKLQCIANFFFRLTDLHELTLFYCWNVCSK